MKNIFFKAVPGLFRKKETNSSNQQRFYSNKVLKSIASLESTNTLIKENIDGLLKSTEKIGAQTEDLYSVASTLKESQEEELGNISSRVNSLSTQQQKSLEMMQQNLYELQKKQQKKIAGQIRFIQSKFDELKADQEMSKINMANEYEVLKVIMEKLGRKIEDIQEEQKEEITNILMKLNETKADMEESNDIHLQNSKANNDLLFKLREHYIEMEERQLEEQKHLTAMLEELRGNVTYLHKLIELNEVVSKQ